MIDEDGPKAKMKGFLPDPADPSVDAENLGLYRSLLSEIDKEKLEENIWDTIVRFEASEKIYGGRYIAMIYDKLIEFAIITSDVVQISFKQFLEYIDTLIAEFVAQRL
jgi:hypothetical protein